MKLLLLKCFICEYWYYPDAHSGHCPNCGSLPLKVGSASTKYFRLEGMRLIEVVRGLPKSQSIWKG